MTVSSEADEQVSVNFDCKCVLNQILLMIN